MSRYKLGIFDKKEGKIINLDSIIKLKNLESLDEFTTEFEDEMQLKLYLYNQGLITKEELNKQIKVIYRYDGKVKNIKVFYSDMKKYLDFEYLNHKLKELSRNIEFLEKLANFYSNGSTKFNKQGTNVSDIRIYLSDVRRNNGETFYSKMLELAIEDLFKKAVFTQPDYKTGEVKDDYRGLRDLAYFIYKFNKLEELKKEKEQTTIQEETWEQSSFFDTDYSNLDEKKHIETISEQEEPDFPPNSMEEADFLRTLDEEVTPISYDIEDRKPHIR